MAQFCTGTFPEPLAFSYRALRDADAAGGDFDLVHDNQCLGYGILAIEKRIPTIVTLHHPITKDRRLEMDHAAELAQALVGRTLVLVRQDAGPGRLADAAHRGRQRELDPRHPRRHGRRRSTACGWCPVGVDPELFRPLPDVERQPGRLITTASADVALKGLSYLLEAVAKLRTERDVTLTVIGKPKAGKTMDLIESLGLRTRVAPSSRASRDERIVELYAEAELAVVPSLYEGFSLPAIEAMATGTALVATDGGALPEVTGRDGDTVLSCRAGDADALAATIAPRPRRRRAAGQGRRRRPPAGARAVDVAALRRADGRAVPRGAGDAGQRRQVAPERPLMHRPCCPDPLRPRRARPAARRPRARRRRRLRPARVRAGPPRPPRRRPRPSRRRGASAPRPRSRAMVEAGEIAAGPLRRRAARRRHPAPVRRRHVRRAC